MFLDAIAMNNVTGSVSLRFKRNGELQIDRITGCDVEENENNVKFNKPLASKCEGAVH